ncbi:hypothetical protein ACWDG9_13680 [Streptomyces sp. NPDC001073]
MPRASPGSCCAGGSTPPEDARILGDAWERGYGDLQWRTLQPDRALPWYALITGGAFGPSVER